MTSPRFELDHLVVAAANLDDGARYIAEQLGVDIPPGGRHAAMGTHNRVMQLGSNCYLEVIAVDPVAPHPGRPRWFDLDNPYLRACLNNAPRLVTYVVRGVNGESLTAIDTNMYGEVMPMSRDQLRWQISIPADGRLPGGGLLPTLLKWQGDPPVAQMSDTGCRLKTLRVCHDSPDWLKSHLDRLGAGCIVDVVAADGMPRIEAHIDSPIGSVVLR